MHDKYARYSLQHIEIAEGLVRLSLPEEMLEAIDMNSLKPGKESFVDDKIAEHFLDVCYTGLLKDGDPLRISILIEHKSKQPDSPLYFQLLRYIVQLNSTEIKQKKQPSLIIPILLYHGDTPFKKEYPEDIYKKYHSAFIASVPRFEYYVTDVSDLSVFERSRLVSRLTHQFILALYYGRNPWLIFENWQEHFIFAPNEHVTGSVEDFLFVTMVYFSSVSEEFKTKYYNSMNYEPKTPEERRFRDFFKKEFLPMIRQVQEEAREEVLAEMRAEMKEVVIAEVTAEVKAEMKEVAIAEVKAFSIQSFISKMPDMTDADVASLFDVTPGYIKDLREKIQNG